MPGFLAGHVESDEHMTGCHAILCPGGMVAAVHAPGFATGGRETEALKPESLAERIHAVVLCGGSAFGLAAASGVAGFLRDRGIGLEVAPGIRVPIVAGAVIFDYPGNRSFGRMPDAEMGRAAAAAAFDGPRLPLGSGPLGAGKSARSGKLGGELSSPSGVGSWGTRLPGGLGIAALAVVNPLGCVADPKTGRIVSGVRERDGRIAERARVLELLGKLPGPGEVSFPRNTVLVAVATDAKLDKLGAARLARMAAAGIPRAIWPSTLLGDGDTVFALSSCLGPAADINFLGALAADAVSRAILLSVPGFSESS
jgi:L-aminopeptidase/D-esterase-like protein